MTSEMGILVRGVSRHSVNVHGTSTVTSPYALSELPIAYIHDYCSSPVCVEKCINPELST